MAFSLACPHCRAVLKSAAPVPAGKKVKCAKCGSAFEAPPLEDATAVTTAAASPRIATRPPDVESADEPAAQNDDQPRSKKQRDEDDLDDEPRAARKPKRKKGGMGVGMLIGLLLVGGVMLVVACGGCGGLGYWGYYLSTRSPIVGTWEQVDQNLLGIRPVNTFDSNGRGTVKLGNVTISYKYRLEGNQLTLEPDQGMGGPLFKGLNPVERYTVAFNGNEMTLTPVGVMPFMAGPQRFRRIN